MQNIFLAVLILLLVTPLSCPVNAVNVPLEWASISIGDRGMYDAAVQMQLSAVGVGVPLSGGPAVWASYYKDPMDKGLKVILLLGSFVYVNRPWDADEIKPLMNWLRDNPEYKDATIAIEPVDEPYWTYGVDLDGDGCPGYSQNNLQQLYQVVKTESGGVPVMYDLGDPVWWDEQNRTGSDTRCYQGTKGLDGIADILVKYVSNISNAGDSSYDQEKLRETIAENRRVLDAVGIKLSIMVSCWTRSSWKRSEQVTYNLVSDILETGDVVGVKFYPYSQNCCGYTDYLKNHPEQFNAIAAAIDGYFYQPESGSSVDTDDEADG